MPCEEVRVGPVQSALRRDREAIAIDQRPDAFGIVRLTTDQNFQIIGQADQAAIEHPVDGS